MRIIIQLCVLLSFCLSSNSQNEGNIWMLGYSGANPCYKAGFDFNSGQLDTFSLCRPIGFFLTNSSICDTSGQLLFYTNGYQIANRDHDFLPNSSGFNPSLTNPEQNVLNIDQGTIILPVPASDSLYYIFHVNGEVFSPPSPEFQPFELRCTLIDISLDNGKGAVVDSFFNVPIYEDTLVLGRLTATKHSNGMDWWLISHRFNSNEYLTFRISADSIYQPIIQPIGSKIKSDIIGNAVFSQDGSKYAVTGWNHFVDVLDFNRCTGEFSNHQKIVVYDTAFVSPDTALLQSCAISPSGDFLYFANYYNLYQVNLNTSPLQSSMVLIDTWEVFLSPFETLFYQMRLAPDNKIYMSTWNGTDRMHVINNPDVADTLCNFSQNTVVPRFNNTALPNLINYQLDSLPKSYCDSLSSNIYSIFSTNEKEVHVYPNPADVSITFRTVKSDRVISDCTIEIIDMTGNVLQRSTNNENVITISVVNLPAATYFYRMIYNNSVSNGLFIVAH